MRDYQSGLVGHPSRMAPSLRGLGGTSASRALVLLDGIPINEPFSGWVHWSRVPLGLVRQVEVVRGGGAGVWGDRALGGVIHMITDEPRDGSLTLTLAGGSHGTARAGVVGSARSGRLGLQLAGDYVGTDGYHNVRPELRGSIDRPVDSRDVVGYAKVIYDPTPLTRVHVSASYLDDFRHNGTPLKRNGTSLTDVRGGIRHAGADGGVITASVYANRTSFDMFFSSDAPDRNSETPSLHQWSVPSNASGAQVQYSREAGDRHALTAGADLAFVDGAVNEDFNYSQGEFIRRRFVSGEQSTLGVYVQDAVTLGSGWRVLASARHDVWRSRDGVRVENDLGTGNALVDTNYAPSALSRPSLSFGVRHQTTHALQLRGSVYSSFRSPTLNELYKPFREAGNIITEANPSLGAERLVGVDVGVDYRIGTRGVARLTAFWSRVHDPILEVTVAAAGDAGRPIAPCGFVPAGGVCKQRQSIDEFRTTGIEAEVEASPRPDVFVRASYTFNPTEVTRALTQPQLVGKEARGTAPHTVSAVIAYTNPSLFDLSVANRYVSARFDDDLNTLRLGSHVVTNVRLSRQATARARAFVSVENLFGAEYEVTRAASGLVRIGGPRMMEVGLQYRVQ
jgi:outer membrane receptor protein involved in Fe transport